MSRKLLAVGGFGVALVALLAAYIWFSGGSGEPSTEVTAPPIGESVTATTASGVATTTTASGVATTIPEATTTSSAESAGGATITYTILKEESSVSFTLEEDLRGTRTTVMGTTDELAGEILVDFATPANSQLGQVVINARTFATGSSFRDRAIRGEILESASDEFEFITFTPTSLDGLPDEVTPGITFNVTGDLTIRTVTQPVVFEVTVSAISEARMEGSATAQVLRSDFDLNIPSVPQVANVTDEVQLVIEFVAAAG